jgi:hypothetical protein
MIEGYIYCTSVSVGGGLLDTLDDEVRNGPGPEDLLDRHLSHLLDQNVVISSNFFPLTNDIIGI